MAWFRVDLISRHATSVQPRHGEKASVRVALPQVHH